MKIQRKLPACLLAVFLSAAPAPAADFEIVDGVIRLFGKSPVNARIVHEQIDSSGLWITATREAGKTRQVRVFALPQQRNPTTVRFEYPFGEASATWNHPIRREGNIVSADVPWNGNLIGDHMDPQEGAEAAQAARETLGANARKQAGLPVIYNSGDSISLGNWPYIEAELADTADFYYQEELSKDHPDVKLTNNGVAQLATEVLTTAYTKPDFNPRYILVNFGLHMINTVGNKPEDYAKSIVQYHELAKQHGAQIIWLNTTPYQPGTKDPQNKIIETFNSLAAKLSQERGFPVIDLHSFVAKEIASRPPAEIYVDGVHFTERMKHAMGNFIGGEVKTILKKFPATPQ